jgi:hypothetical protein
MAEIIYFPQTRRGLDRDISHAIVEKTIDGEMIELIDFELLSPDEQCRLLTRNSSRKKK